VEALAPISLLMLIAKSEDPATAADVAERLNEDADRREEDNWSA
jgi:hypothetical protein